MTPEQRRLIAPLTRQDPARKLANLVSALSLTWPFSIVRTWLITYCATFSAVVDPICLPPAGRPRPASATRRPTPRP